MLPLSINRRRFLSLTAASATLAAFSPTAAFANSAQKKRLVYFSNLRSGERIETNLFSTAKNTAYELNKIYHICRDVRQNKVHVIDKALITQLYSIQTLLSTDADIQIISGYRSPSTNNMLRSQGNSGVAKKSYHMQGRALDFRLAGIPLDEVRDAAISIRAGGVGYYPDSDFVHIDTGTVRTW